MPLDPEKINQYKVEDVYQDIIFQWMYDKKIATFKVFSLKNHVIDKWFSKSMEIVGSWPENQMLLTLQDFSECKGFITTPYLRQKSKEATLIRPDLHARTAVIIPKSFTVKVLRMFITALPKPNTTVKRERGIFFERDKALEWLLEKLEQPVEKNNPHDNS